MSPTSSLSNNFYALTIHSIEQDTRDAVIVRFNIPTELRNTFTFTPGQYLTLRATVNDQDIRRSYSICSAVDEPTLAVGIKKLKDGQFSNYAHQLSAGEALDVMPPQGRFTASLGGKHHYLLLAAGSGITPIYSIARSVLENEPDSFVTLCCVNKSIDSVMFRNQLDDLKDRFLTRFLLTHLMTAEAQDVALFNGRLDREKIDTMVIRGLITPSQYDAIYICGPESMIHATKEALIEMGIPEKQIRFELFASNTTPAHSTEHMTQHTDNTIEISGADVHVILDGVNRKFRLPTNTQLMDAAAKAGLELPWSCANGMCATCRCKLIEGDITMKQNFSLEPWELESGYVLACQIIAKSDKVVIDFDAV